MTLVMVFLTTAGKQTFALEIMEYLIVNKTEDLIKDTETTDIVLLPESTKDIPEIPPVIYKGSKDISQEEYQYYVIGVYSFFAFLFAFGLIVVLARKLKKTCCDFSKREDPDFESFPHRNSTCSQDNLGFDSQRDELVTERTNAYDSDYDYYSDASSEETKSMKDEPPEYEEPPSYMVASQSC